MSLMESHERIVSGTRAAVLSKCGNYRYVLMRQLQGMGPPMVFCMLNPSTADHANDDPTIRRCIGFANREGASALAVINLFAFRSTNPYDLLADGMDPVGPENDEAIRGVLRTMNRRVVCAWGASLSAECFVRSRAISVERMLRATGAELVCLGTTARGLPRHPLYVKADQPLVPYNGR
jgi:hypothetical protein